LARVACIMMQKNEGELLRSWIEYYRFLFGHHNLFIFDNASDDPHTLSILDKYQSDGISVNKRFLDADSHTKRNKIFGDMITSLDAARYFDFFIPIDCDEFFVLKTENKKICTDSKVIHAELNSLLKYDQAFGIDTSYYNILGKPDQFFVWPQRKTFFKAGTFSHMDSGFHEGASRLAPGKHETQFAHIHYHHKPYATIVEHSKNKLRAFFDPDNEEELRNPKNKNRLTDFILQGEASYMSKFETTGVLLPEIGETLRALGAPIPFT
jgi:Glycosyl transferase family 2